MKRFVWMLAAAVIFPASLWAQPFTTDSNTVALWHFDEISGNLVTDASLLHNGGTAYGATIVPGRFGNGRLFNGTSAFVDVPNPPSGCFSFGPNQSFTIDVWFKSTAGGVQEIVRRGLAPYPGYNLRLHDGHVEAEIGNRWDGTPPDTVLRITSDHYFNDGTWHLATMVRDRAVQKLFLYVDGVQATRPLDDHFPYALSNTFSLNIGYWAALGGVEFFNGTLDEIRILRVARHPVATTSDSVAIWHLDELSGQNVVDSSPYHNNGTAIGTTIVPGRFGNARSFSGSGNYISVPNPVSGEFNFASNQSFTIEAWFKTTQADTGEILRRGLAPVAGYALRIFQGRVQGIIGDREDMPPPSMLLRITSTSLYNDGNWHHATLIRDRAQGKLYLYVDEMQAAPPLNDNFTLPITNDRPLMIGRWENYIYPTYLRGSIDEVKIFRGARHPGSFFAPDIRVSPLAMEFGSVAVGTQSQQMLEIFNDGTRDTLRVTEIGSNNSVFSTTATTLVIPPSTSHAIQIRYLPTTARTDTGLLSIASNDPNQPVVRVPLRGRGIQLGAAPIISSIRDIPNDQGKQVRVIWYRSTYDGLNDSLHIATYNLWRRVDGGMAQLSPPHPSEGTAVVSNGHTHLFSNNELWDFIATVPAVRFEQYAYIAPTLFDSTVHGGIHWTTFKVSAHTTTSVIFFSAPDSGYSVDNLPPLPPVDFSAVRITNAVQLAWEAPPDPDIRNYVVHRSTQANFVPSPQTLIGTPSATNHIDNQVAGLPAVYYRVATVDSAGNQSVYSEEIGLVLTGTVGGGSTPTQFALYQNYPNPFNPETIIEYDVPVESHVVVAIYDVRGKELERLVDEQRPVGSFRVSWKPNDLATGIYFCRMTAGTYSSVRKILYVK